MERRVGRTARLPRAAGLPTLRSTGAPAEATLADESAEDQVCLSTAAMLICCPSFCCSMRSMCRSEGQRAL